jgi:hypothetical protein
MTTFAQRHLWSAVYALATRPGTLTERLGEAEDSIMKAAEFNADELPPHLQGELLALYEDMVETRKAQIHSQEEEIVLAGRIVTLLADSLAPATH